MTAPESGSSAVLFDLDGTFADTAPDMAYALNLQLRASGREPLPFERIRPHVSHGARAMIRLGFGLTPEEPEFERLRGEFLEIYRAHLVRETSLFPGIEQLTHRLDARGTPWGIVTNKPGWLTDPLVRSLGLDGRPGCVVSGDTTPNAKPHPEPILHACRILGADPARTWYVGDAERDIVAGKAAGARTLVALFGYLGEEEAPETWGADGLIADPLDVLDWI